MDGQSQQPKETNNRDLFGDDHLPITSYSNKNTLIFQGDAGIKLKEQIISLLERKDCIVNSIRRRPRTRNRNYIVKKPFKAVKTLI